MFFVVCGLWFVVCGLWDMVCGIWFVVRGVRFDKMCYEMHKSLETLHVAKLLVLAERVKPLHHVTVAWHRRGGPLKGPVVGVPTLPLHGGATSQKTVRMPPPAPVHAAHKRDHKNRCG